MATETRGLFSQHDTLFPKPLHINKKSHRSIFPHKSMRKISTAPVKATEGLGWFDDIIDEIACGLFYPLQTDPVESEFLGWTSGFGTPFDWAHTSLPVSRIPSDEPLTVRKLRNSDSSAASGFSDDVLFSSRDSSRGNSTDSEYYIESSPPEKASDRSFSRTVSGKEPTPAEQKLSTILEDSEASPAKFKQRGSLKRLFTNPLAERRAKAKAARASSAAQDDKINEHDDDTNLQATSSQATVMRISLPVLDSLVRYDINGTEMDSLQSTLDADDVETQVAQKALKSLKLDDDFGETRRSPKPEQPSVLAVAVRALPQVEVLDPAKDHEIFWVAVELEGISTNACLHSYPILDIVFVVDNSYYVTSHCLHEALTAAMSSLHRLQRNDRIGLYTTRCAHEVVTGTIPEVLIPLQKVSQNLLDLYGELIRDIGAQGTQKWEPLRPNPDMVEVVRAIANSLEEPRHCRTHIIVLTPVTTDLHQVSKPFPFIRMHQINPSVLPYTGNREDSEILRDPGYLTLATTSNFHSYQTPASRIKRIIKDGRFGRAWGQLSDIRVKIRAESGCKVLKIEGGDNIDTLRFGQIHTLFVKIAVTKSETRCMNLESLTSMVDKNTRPYLQNAPAMGASKVHLLSVKVVYKNTMQPEASIHSKIPLLVFKELGKMQMPKGDPEMVFYKRRLFHIMCRMSARSMDNYLKTMDGEPKARDEEAAKKYLALIRKEVESHVKIAEYEESSRKKIPKYPGHVSVPTPHDWVLSKLEARKLKRQGVIFDTS